MARSYCVSAEFRYFIAENSIDSDVLELHSSKCTVYTLKYINNFYGLLIAKSFENSKYLPIIYNTKSVCLFKI